MHLESTSDIVTRRATRPRRRRRTCILPETRLQAKIGVVGALRGALRLERRPVAPPRGGVAAFSGEHR